MHISIYRFIHFQYIVSEQASLFPQPNQPSLDPQPKQWARQRGAHCAKLSPAGRAKRIAEARTVGAGCGRRPVRDYLRYCT